MTFSENPRHHRDRPPIDRPNPIRTTTVTFYATENRYAINRAKAAQAPFTFLGPDKEPLKQAYYRGMMDGFTWESWGQGYRVDVAWLGSTKTAEQITGEQL